MSDAVALLKSLLSNTLLSLYSIVKCFLTSLSDIQRQSKHRFQGVRGLAQDMNR